MTNIVTDISVKKNWIARTGVHNVLKITFVDAVPAAFDVTGYIFTLEVREQNRDTDRLQLTEAAGLTNGGVLGTLVATLTPANMTTIGGTGTYFWQLSVTDPSTNTQKWFTGDFIAINDVSIETQASETTATLTLGGSEITATMTVSDGLGAATQSEYNAGTITNKYSAPSILKGAEPDTFTVANEITYDDAKGKQGVLVTGGTHAFTLAASGNLNDATVHHLLNAPAAVSFSSDFEAVSGSDTFNLTKLNQVFSWYLSATSKAYYLNKVVNVLDNISPTLDSGVMGDQSVYIDLTFSEGVYDDTGAAAVLAADLSISFLQATGTATDCTISSIKQNDSAVEGSATALAGGETVIRVFLTVTGSADGNETIEITPIDGASIADASINFLDASETTGAVNLTPTDRAFEFGAWAYFKSDALSYFNLTTRNSNDKAIDDWLDQSGNGRNMSYDAAVTIARPDGPVVDNSTTPTKLTDGVGLFMPTTFNALLKLDWEIWVKRKVAAWNTSQSIYAYLVGGIQFNAWITGDNIYVIYRDGVNDLQGGFGSVSTETYTTPGDYVFRFSFDQSGSMIVSVDNVALNMSTSDLSGLNSFPNMDLTKKLALSGRHNTGSNVVDTDVEIDVYDVVIYDKILTTQQATDQYNDLA